MSTVALDDVVARIAEVTGVAAEAVTLQTPLDSLVNDSFALVEMAIALQEDFDVIFTQDDLRDVMTVGQIFELLNSRVSSASPDRRSDDG
jgi:acyl carrier protein